MDFGDLQVFEGVTTYPAILVLRKEKPSERAEVQGTAIETLEAEVLEKQLRAPGVIVRQRELEPDGWRFEDRLLAGLRQKVRDVGVPLTEYCGSPLYGIKTGLNEAFVIESHTRDALIAQNKKCSEIIKPYLGGKDLKPWSVEWRGLWLIYTHHGIDMKPYPEVLEHLRTYKKRLEARATAHIHPWYELQQPQFEFTSDMEGPKIMYPDMSNRPKFVFDDTGYYFGNTTYFIPEADRYLQAVLCTKTMWWYIAQICPALRGGLWRYRLFTQYMETLPIAQPSAADRKKLSALAEALSEKDCPNRLTLEAELNDRVANLYGLTAEEKKIVEGILPAAKDDGSDGDVEEGEEE